MSTEIVRCAECGYPAWYHERTKDAAEMGVCWTWKDPADYLEGQNNECT